MLRRTFILSGVVGLATFFCRLGEHPLFASPIEENELNFDIELLFNDSDSAREIGKYYLHSSANVINFEKLAKDAYLYRLESKRFLSVKRLKKEMSAIFKEDFHEGNTVIVNGYVLARSEASLCGLLAFND